jgi:hypothetical protein
MNEVGVGSLDNGAGLKELLKEGWAYHDKESERLARELEAAAGPDVAPSLLAPLIHLSNHTIGAHLGDWTRALALGRRVLDGRTPVAETAKAWGRLSVAALLAGDLLQAAALELSHLAAAGDDVAAALIEMRFMLIDALVAGGRGGPVLSRRHRPCRTGWSIGATGPRHRRRQQQFWLGAL